MTRVTMGRPIIHQTSCSANDRRNLQFLAEVLNSIGSPGPAGRASPPIAAEAYPGTFFVDFELNEPFGDPDGNNIVHASAQVLAPNGSPAPEDNAPPQPPTAIDVCAFNGMWPETLEGHRGTATYRLDVFGNPCWWVFFLFVPPPTTPGGGPSGDFDADGEWTDDGDGPDPEGGGNFSSAPGDPGHVCFVAGEIDHWVNFGQGRHPAKTENWSIAFWYKNSAGQGPHKIIGRDINDSTTVHDWKVETVGSAGSSGRFKFTVNFVDENDNLLSPVYDVESDNGTWKDQIWHFVVCKITSSGDMITVHISIDGGEFNTLEDTLIAGKDAAVQQTTKHTLSNAEEEPPVLGTDTGDFSFCLDNIRFYDDRSLSDDAVAILFAQGHD